MSNNTITPASPALEDAERLAELRAMAVMNDEPILEWAADRIAALSAAAAPTSSTGEGRVHRWTGALVGIKFGVAWRGRFQWGRVGDGDDRAR
jgi:hypothetical protein